MPGPLKKRVLECHYFQMARNPGNVRLGAAGGRASVQLRWRGCICRSGPQGVLSYTPKFRDHALDEGSRKW